jgi:hypothetical protein
VLGHWWEQVLHNQSALRIKTRLLMQPGVVVASVPYQLQSAMRLRPPPGKPPAVSPPGAPAAAAAGAAGHPAAHQETAGQATHAPAAGQGDRLKPTGQGDRAPPVPALQRLTADREKLQAEELKAEVSNVQATPIADCLEHQVVNVTGTLRTVTLRPRGTSLTMEADLWDGTGTIKLVWLGRREIRGIRPGRRVIAHGRIAMTNDERVMYNPSYELRPGPGPESPE